MKIKLYFTLLYFSVFYYHKRPKRRKIASRFFLALLIYNYFTNVLTLCFLIVKIIFLIIIISFFI